MASVSWGDAPAEDDQRAGRRVVGFVGFGELIVGVQDGREVIDPTARRGPTAAARPPASAVPGAALLPVLDRVCVRHDDYAVERELTGADRLHHHHDVFTGGQGVDPFAVS